MLAQLIMGFGAIVAVAGLVLLVVHKRAAGDHEMDFMGVKLKVTAPPAIIVFIVGSFIFISPEIFPTFFHQQDAAGTVVKRASSSTSENEISSVTSNVALPAALGSPSSSGSRASRASVSKPTASSNSAPLASANHIVINEPTLVYKGTATAVNICKQSNSWGGGRDCGQSAADLFCKAKSFGTASSYKSEPAAKSQITLFQSGYADGSTPTGIAEASDDYRKQNPDLTYLVFTQIVCRPAAE